MADIKTCEEYVLAELEKYIKLYEYKNNALFDLTVENELLKEKYDKLVAFVKKSITQYKSDAEELNNMNYYHFSPTSVWQDEEGYDLLDSIYNSEEK